MTYSDLQTTIANWLHRSDLSSVIPSFITQGEAALNRNLLLTDMLERTPATAPTSDRYIDLPDGMLEMLEIKNTSVEPVEKLKYVPPDQIVNHYPSDLTSTQRPEWYTIKDKIELNCISDDTYSLEILYYKKLDIATDNTNWLLTNYPDAYIYASLVPAAVYIGSPDKAVVYQAKMNEIISEINRKEIRKRGSRKARLVVDEALTAPSRGYDIVSGT